MFNNHEYRVSSNQHRESRIKHPVSKIDKLINKFTNSQINCLNRARNNNKNMQNEPNLKIDQFSGSTPFHEFFICKLDTGLLLQLIRILHFPIYKYLDN